MKAAGKTILTIIVTVAGVIYPFLVFYFLVILKAPVRIFSLVVVAFGLGAFITATSGKNAGAGALKSRIFTGALMAALGLLCFVSGSGLFLKLYPLAVTTVMLLTFGWTLFSPPPLIFRFACLMDKSIKGSPAEKLVEVYCRKVTIVWCVFFILNDCVSAWTALAASDAVWSVYNGGVSYVLIGLLFAIEYIVRRQVNKKMPKSFPPPVLSGETLLSRSASSVKAAFCVPEESDYFDGHFPDFKLLPAVAQVDIVLRLVRRYLDCACVVREIKRLKFQQMIRPGTPLAAEISFREVGEGAKGLRLLNWTITSPDGETVYSTGSVDCAVSEASHG
jgi:uncharacterized membrane protein/3-hydroxymyristoyl/3-hydroxydecanoyl-(acyl carrier protein) dehydratase